MSNTDFTYLEGFWHWVHVIKLVSKRAFGNKFHVFDPQTTWSDKFIKSLTKPPHPLNKGENRAFKKVIMWTRKKLCVFCSFSFCHPVFYQDLQRAIHEVDSGTLEDSSSQSSGQTKPSHLSRFGLEWKRGRERQKYWMKLWRNLYLRNTVRDQTSPSV